MDNLQDHLYRKLLDMSETNENATIEFEEQDGKMSEKEINEYKEAFMLFDKNGDGYISTKEMITLLRSLGQDPSKEQAQKIINIFDDDGNGQISYDEFMSLVDRLVEDTETEEELVEIFNIIDVDGDGQISKRDLLDVSFRLGACLSHKDLTDMIDEFDRDGDGLLDFEEFRRIISSNS